MNASAVNNLKTVVENDKIPTTVAIDATTANAYLEDTAATENVNKVFSELEDVAEEIIPEEPEVDKVSVKNMYTKLTLDESIEDVYLYTNRVEFTPVDEDDYLDYDMFDFIYGIVTDEWPRPKNPLGKRIRKFQHTDSDDYKKTNTPTGMSQVSTDMEGNVVVYANESNAFDDTRKVCDYYHIKYSDVRHSVRDKSHWAFNMTIYVPSTAEGYPVLVEDFFEPYGLTVADVIEDQKAGKGKTTNWGDTYAKKVERDLKPLIKRREELNDAEVEGTFKKFVAKASLNGDVELNVFLKELIDELDSNDLKYSKEDITARFLAEFEDDFEDEE